MIQFSSVIDILVVNYYYLVLKLIFIKNFKIYFWCR